MRLDIVTVCTTLSHVLCKLWTFLCPRSLGLSVLAQSIWRRIRMGKTHRERCTADKNKKGRSRHINSNGREDTMHSRREKRQWRGTHSMRDTGALEAVLRTQQLQCVPIDGDGNCLFRSLAHQLQYVRWSSAEREASAMDHHTVRAAVIEVMSQAREHYMMFVDLDEEDESDAEGDTQMTDAVFDRYLERMRQSGQWGGSPELYAAAQCFGVDILIHQLDAPPYLISHQALTAAISTSTTTTTSSSSSMSRPTVLLQLSFHGDCHYNSVITIGDDSVIKHSVHDRHAFGMNAMRETHLSVEFIRRIQQSVPWMTDTHLQIATRMLNTHETKDERERDKHRLNKSNTTTTAAAAVVNEADEMIDFLCEHMHELRVGALDHWLLAQDNDDSATGDDNDKTTKTCISPDSTIMTPMALKDVENGLVGKEKTTAKGTVECMKTGTDTGTGTVKAKGGNKVLSKKERRRLERTARDATAHPVAKEITETRDFTSQSQVIAI